MADETDLDELARRYLDLWQDQMSALASDPAAAETMTRLMTAAGVNASAAWAAWPAATGRNGEASEKDPDGAAAGQAEGATASPGAAAIAATSGGGGLDLDRLASRLAELEERVRALESGPRRGRGGASGKPRGS